MAKKRANGEGNIRKRKDGRWEGRYTAGYDEKTGKRLIKNVLGKTQAEVKEKLAKAVAEAESVDVRRADEYTLGTWLQTWYELYAKPHLRFSTAEYYRRGIELHIVPRIGDIPLKKLTGRDLQWLYKDLQEHGRLREAQKGKQPGLSDSTIRGIHTMLHNALDRAVKERLIVRNPADDCIPPKIPKHEMKILPPEQIKSYLTAADQRGVLPMFYLELISGLRKGELVALQWSDLDIENKTISVSKQAGRNNAGEPDITRPKTENSIRKISIPQDAVDLLIAEHKKHPSNPWMFPSPKTGEMYHPDSVVNIHKKILKDAGLEHLRFHDLRHPYVKYTTKIFSLRLMDFQAQAYNSFERLPPPMPISISSIVCSGSFLFLEKSFPGTFTHASKFAAVFFIAWNNADRTRSGYDFLFTWKASLKNVIIFKAKPSIFIDLSSVFLRNIVFICPPALK